MFLRLIAFIILFASSAQALDPQREQLLLKLIRDSDCSLTGDEAGKILPKHGFTPAETKEIENSWLERGWIDTSKLMTITLTKEACKS